MGQNQGKPEISYLEASKYPRPSHRARTSALNDLAVVASDRYETSSQIDDLEEAISRRRAALDLLPPGSSKRPSVLRNLSQNFYTRYKKTGNMEDLDEAILLLREVLSLYPAGSLKRALSLNNLAVNISTRYDSFGKIEDLEEAISFHREALSLFPPGHDNRASSLNNFADDLSAYYKTSGKIDDLDEAISFRYEALSLPPLDRPKQASSLNHLADDLWTRYELLGNMEDLEETITFRRQVLSLRPSGSPKQASSFNNLADDLVARYEKLGNIEDLEEAISFRRKALSIRQPGSAKQPLALNHLADDVYARYEKLGNVADLEEVISLFREAVSLCPPGSSRWHSSLDNLAGMLVVSHKLFGKIEDLEESISFRREALSLDRPGSSKRASCLNNLAKTLSIRYSALRRIDDLEEAIVFHREAINLCTLDNGNRASFLNSEAVDLSTRYGILGKIEDLKEAVSLHREVLSLHPPGSADRGLFLNNIALDLSTCYEVFGKVAHLDESISLHREALSLKPVGNDGRLASLNNLGGSLFIRYQVYGRVEDLEETISYDREALSLCSTSSLKQSSSLLSNLSLGLSARYRILRRREDLEESVALCHQALSLIPPGHWIERVVFLHNLAQGFFTCYESFGKVEDLEESIKFHREALSLFPAIMGNNGHPISLLSLLNNLGICLSIRYEVFGKIEDLTEAISFLQKAHSLAPPGSIYRTASLDGLARSLTIRYGLLDEIKDLETAFSLHQEALNHLPPGHPNRSKSLASLAEVLCIRHHRFGRVEDLQDLFIFYEQAACDGSSLVQSRLNVAVRWATVATVLRHNSVLSAYTTSLHLLSRCLLTRSSLESQQNFLATVPIPVMSLASDAACAAIEAGNTELAVEFLEQGRAMLWSRVDGYKYPLQQLRGIEGGGKLADRLEALGAELEHFAFLSSNHSRPMLDMSTAKRSPPADAEIKQHRLLSEEWEDIVGRIRKFEGFNHFLQAPPFKTLQSAAAEGPVILVNISMYRSDAIILLKDSLPDLVNLPDVLLSELLVQAQNLGSDSEQVVKRMQSYLWRTMVSPIVDRLTQLGIQKKSRIWWCPTGILCAFPLHAAGRGKRNLQDIYVSSYTSTLSSLIKARSDRASPPTMGPRLLVVGEPSTVQVLEKVKDEIDKITALRPDDSVNVLFGPKALREDVLNRLKDHSWVHFACHGRLGDKDQPFRASFELHNGPLPLLDIIRARLPNAEFAFLSACHSASGNSRTPDESINLSAALQFCGFRSVVGTLWEMDDEDGPTLSEKFYQNMFCNPDKIDFRVSAHALNRAIQEMRKDGVPPERWVMFVHIGA